MSNPFPTSYAPVPVSNNLINSPHSYSGSPGPMGGVMPGTMSGQMGGGISSMSGMSNTMPPGMSPVMGGGMGPGMGNTMGTSMGPIMSSGMSNSINSTMGGMGGGMGGGISGAMGGLSSGMGMSPVLSNALSSNTISTNMSHNVMSPGMPTSMVHSMQAGAMGPNLGSSMGGMSPMPMPYSSNAQGREGMVQGQGPTNTPGNNPCDPVSSGVANSRLGGGAPSDVTTTTQSSRDINTASLCRIGQETVQDIISRTQEIFQTFKTIQPPNGTAAGSNAANEKKLKVQDQLRTIRILFKRLRLIYEKCNDNSQLQGMEYTHIESLIPLRDEWDGKSEERKNSEAFRQATEEHKELVEAVVSKNRVLKDIIDHMRRVIWEINTMLMMRRS